MYKNTTNDDLRFKSQVTVCVKGSRTRKKSDLFTNLNERLREESEKLTNNTTTKVEKEGNNAR